MNRMCLPLSQSGWISQFLPELKAFPDSIFIEHPSFVFTEGAVLLRPGASTRQGETAEIPPILHDLFDNVLELSQQSRRIYTSPSLDLVQITHDKG
jgi:N-dimethylarginine dimethylaminohydrolase